MSSHADTIRASLGRRLSPNESVDAQQALVGLLAENQRLREALTKVYEHGDDRSSQIAREALAGDAE